MKLPIDQIKPSPYSTRPKEMDVISLAKSIREHGQLQPIKVRPIADGYECVFGHRRLAAMEMASLTEIEVIVQELDEREARLQIWQENEEREDLSDLARAQFIEAYGEDYCKQGNKISLSALCKEFNLSAVHITNLRCLLWEHPSIQSALSRREVTEHQVREVRSILKDDEPARVQVIQEAVRGDLDPAPGKKFTIQHVVARAEELKAGERAEQQIKSQEFYDDIPQMRVLLRQMRDFKQTLEDVSSAFWLEKMSPEGEHFVARRLREIARLASELADDLED